MTSEELNLELRRDVEDSLQTYTGVLGFSTLQDLLNTYPQHAEGHLARDVFFGNRERAAAAISELIRGDAIDGVETDDSSRA